MEYVLRYVIVYYMEATAARKIHQGMQFICFIDGRDYKLHAPFYTPVTYPFLYTMAHGCCIVQFPLDECSIMKGWLVDVDTCGWFVYGKECIYHIFEFFAAITASLLR